MARDYGNRRPSRSRKSAPHQFLVMILVFLLGYLTASVCDVDTISHWVNAQVLAHHEMNKAPGKPQAQQAAIPPKPKFEFYTLLANEKTPGSQPGAHAQANQSPPTTTPAPKAQVAAPVNAVAGTSAAPMVKTSVPKVQQPAAIKAAEVKPVATPALAGKGTYVVQVASFKARQDAEHMKGSLILKGFNVSVIPVTYANKGSWFRVVVGPYPNRMLAQKAQLTLAKNERLNGMVTGGG